MKDLYRFAELNIEIDSPGARVHALCADYRTRGEADFSVVITQEQIERERAASARALTRRRR